MASILPVKVSQRQALRSFRSVPFLKRFPMRSYLVALSGLLLTATVARSQADAPVFQTAAIEQLEANEGKVPSAEKVLSDARKVAAKENKKVLVLFHASWCGWCKKMEKAMEEPALKPLFEKNYVIRWLTVYESPARKGEENPGAEDLLKQYKGNDQGIPYFLIFDAKGKMLADSQKAPGENVGCPAEPDEVAYFVSVLKKTTSLTERELQTVAERFRKNKG
jgi:thioredoxin-related protein